MIKNRLEMREFGAFLVFVFLLIFGGLDAFSQSSVGRSVYMSTGAKIGIYGVHTFVSGSVYYGDKPDDLSTKVVFAPKSSYLGASDLAYMGVYVQSRIDGSFIFPVGDNGNYYPIELSQSNGATVAYFSGTSSAYDISNVAPTSGADEVSSKGYWRVIGTGSSKVRITWNVSNDVASLVYNSMEYLTIAGWNIATSSWESLASTADNKDLYSNSQSTFSKGSITTDANIPLGKYSAYTLARLKPSRLVISYTSDRETQSSPVPIYFSGETVVYQIKVVNQGSVARNVIIKKPQSPYMQFLSATSKSADDKYDPTTGSWTISSVKTGETSILTVVEKIDNAAVFLMNPQTTVKYNLVIPPDTPILTVDPNSDTSCEIFIDFDPNSDLDGDSVSDVNEIVGKGLPPAKCSGPLFRGYYMRDTDCDGLMDYEDVDDDGDGVYTKFEQDNRDTDRDGIPNYLDDDDDGDGIPTSDEGADPNFDGDPSDARISNKGNVPDYLNFDNKGETNDDNLGFYALITPNNDGINDIFEIRNVGLFPDNFLQIYDRSGALVYSAQGYGKPSNMFKGEANQGVLLLGGQLPEGVYYYNFSYKNASGVSKQKIGNFYLSRDM